MDDVLGPVWGPGGGTSGGSLVFILFGRTVIFSLRLDLS